MSIAVSKFCHEEEYIEKCRASAKKKWEDPDFVEKMKNSRQIAAKKNVRNLEEKWNIFQRRKKSSFWKKMDA